MFLCWSSVSPSVAEWLLPCYPATAQVTVEDLLAMTKVTIECSSPAGRQGDKQPWREIEEQWIHVVYTIFLLDYFHYYYQARGVESRDRSARNVSSKVFMVNHRGLQNNRNKKICPFLLMKSKLSLQTLIHRWLKEIARKILQRLLCLLQMKISWGKDLPSSKSQLFLRVMTLSYQPWQPKNTQQEHCLSFPAVSLHGCHSQI